MFCHFWSEWFEDIYFELLEAFTQVNMLSLRNRLKVGFCGDNSLKILMIPA